MSLIQAVGWPLYRLTTQQSGKYEGWSFNSGYYLFTTDTK